MRVALLQMPYSDVEKSSLALTQLKSLVQRHFKDAVHVRIFYLNHDAWGYFGKELYAAIAGTSPQNGVADWMFALEAMGRPGPSDDSYLKRWPLDNRAQNGDALEKRRGLGALISETISSRALQTFDVIGISAAFSVVPGLAYARHLKRMDGKRVVVLGGSSVKHAQGRSLIRSYEHIDYVCTDDGRVVFPRLISALLNAPGDAEGIPGLLSRSNFSTNDLASGPYDINDPIELDYSDFLESYDEKIPQPKPTAALEFQSSLGCCWGECTFCGNLEHQKSFVFKEPGIAVRELQDLLKRYPDKHIQWVDNSVPPLYYKKVFPLLEVPESASLFLEARGNLTREQCRVLKRSRVTLLQPGIESFSSDCLRLMEKGTTGLQAISCLKNCVEFGIVPLWNVLVAFPGMTDEMYAEITRLIPLLSHLPPPMVLSPVRYDRYSKYFENPKRYGLRLKCLGYYKAIYPFPPDFFEDFPYYHSNSDLTAYEVLSKHWDALAPLIESWKSLWKASPPGSLPSLHRVTDGERVSIEDSRSGALKRVEIGPCEDAILASAREPTSLERIVSGSAPFVSDEIAAGLKRLSDQHLVLEDNKRVLSLVLDSEPRDFFKRYEEFLDFARWVRIVS
jgi:ribosomal peptide maturation radical SAM protein 1